MSSLSKTSTKMYALILLSLLPSASAQVSAFFENAPPCHKDCTPLWNVNYDCMQLGRVDLECMCSSKWMEQLYAGGTCSCEGSAGEQLREWLDGADRCAEYQSRFDATGVKTTSQPTSTSSSGRGSITSAPKTTGTASDDDDSSATNSDGLITATMSGFESASETGGKSLATAEAASDGGSWESKKKWAIPVIAVAAIGGALAFALLAFCIWRRRRNERRLGNYAGVMGGSNGHAKQRPPWWTFGGVVGGRKKNNKARESAMSEAGHGLVADEYRPSFEPPSTRVLQRDQYGNYMPRTQGPAYITAGSYPHGRPLSPVEELRSAAATPSIASVHGGNVSPPPPEGYQPGPSVFRDIPEGAVVSPSTPDNTGARVPPAAPSTGLGFTGAGAAGARDITPPSRQLSNASSTYSGYSDSGVSDARSSPFPLLASQKRKPVRRNFNPEGSPPSNNSSVRSGYNPVSPVSPIATSEPSDASNGFRQYTSPPPPPLSPLRHPRVKSSPQYYEDYNAS